MGSVESGPTSLGLPVLSLPIAVVTEETGAGPLCSVPDSFLSCRGCSTLFWWKDPLKSLMGLGLGSKGPMGEHLSSHLWCSNSFSVSTTFTPILLYALCDSFWVISKGLLEMIRKELTGRVKKKKELRLSFFHANLVSCSAWQPNEYKSRPMIVSFSGETFAFTESKYGMEMTLKW